MAAGKISVGVGNISLSREISERISGIYDSLERLRVIKTLNDNANVDRLAGELNISLISTVAVLREISDEHRRVSGLDGVTNEGVKPFQQLVKLDMGEIDTLMHSAANLALTACACSKDFPLVSGLISGAVVSLRKITEEIRPELQRCMATPPRVRR